MSKPTIEEILASKPEARPRISIRKVKQRVAEQWSESNRKSRDAA